MVCSRRSRNRWSNSRLLPLRTCPNGYSTSSTSNSAFRTLQAYGRPSTPNNSFVARCIYGHSVLPNTSPTRRMHHMPFMHAVHLCVLAVLARFGDRQGISVPLHDYRPVAKLTILVHVSHIDKFRAQESYLQNTDLVHVRYFHTACRRCPSMVSSLRSHDAFGRTREMLSTWYTRPTAWVFKMDDDTWLDVDKLMAHIQATNSSTHYYGGFKMMAVDGLFASGGAGYLISRRTMEDVDFRRQCQWHYDQEDVGIGKCMRETIQLLPTDIPVNPDTPEKMIEWWIKPSPDHVSHHRPVSTAISYHYMSPERIRKPWIPGRAFPKRMHQVWLGKSKPPPLDLISACASLHYDWEYTLWTDDNLGNITYDSKYQEKGSFTLRYLHARGAVGDILKAADLVRLEVLYRYGGVAMDADQVCLKRMDPLLELGRTYDWVAAHEHEHDHSSVKRLVACGVQIAHPYSPSIYRALAHVPFIYLGKSAWTSTGPCLISQAIVYPCGRETRPLCGQAYSDADECERPAPLHLLPSRAFYPYHHSEVHLMSRCKHSLAKSYTLQHWSSTRNTYMRASRLLWRPSRWTLDERGASLVGKWPPRHCTGSGNTVQGPATSPGAYVIYTGIDIPAGRVLEAPGTYNITKCNAIGCENMLMASSLRLTSEMTSLRVFGKSPVFRIGWSGVLNNLTKAQRS